ncbi:unnamed protein product [Acanthoscelides obtectus]|uniref:DDE Tnp4 domain-containing protein n=1 Tax=Acanthoscelides obtectus TaxID=200917 RepID=A0A9P0L7A7_ACAOB|nr:unnamed protein product [Acanthoscelides obtectus]CAK1671743.1 Putative nuclease HARBI1 [Acanthoscelides obtectus]
MAVNPVFVNFDVCFRHLIENVLASRSLRLQFRNIRDTSNPLEIPDKFKKLFRLNKAAIDLITQLQEYVGEASRRDTTFSSADFWRIAQFPDVIGVIDCTHIAIVPPKIDDPVNPSIAYINRKGFHSVNVQAIFDSQLMLTNVNAKYSEAVHDAAIWDSSNIQTHLGQKYEDGRRNCYLLGDSGYHLQPWLMTPILETRPNTPEEQEYEDNDNSDDILKRLVTAAILILLQFQAIIF